jgi:hypothetical protein
MALLLEPDASYLIAMVASLHYLDFETAMRRLESLLRPGGRLIVGALSVNTSIADWVLPALALPVI